MFVRARSSLRPAPREWKGIAGALIVVLSASAGNAWAQGAKPGKITAAALVDRSITAAVEAELAAAPAVPAHAIEVVTSDRVVRLGGTVASLPARLAAVEEALEVFGVTAVVDSLRVSPPERKDVDIRRAIELNLVWNPLVESGKVRVSVKDGVVRLEGEVDNWLEKDVVLESALWVRGVKAIENRLEIGSAGLTGDSLRGAIQSALFWDNRVDSRDIRVTARGRQVELQGKVASGLERSRAVRDAYMAGAETVTDSALRIDPSFVASPIGKLTDRDVENAIRGSLLLHPYRDLVKADVSVQGQVVSLQGTVPSLQIKHTLGETVLDLRGVRRVVNNLKVRPTRQLPDAEIAERVRNALTAHTLVDRYQIGVRVEGSEVQLLGQVESQLEKEAAEWIAAGISGVMAVENDIRVETPVLSKTDPELQEDVKSQFFWSPFVDGEDIRVTADRGVVTLTGKVDSWTEYRSATANAVEAGAVGVINRLDVVTGA